MKCLACGIIFSQNNGTKAKETRKNSELVWILDFLDLDFNGLVYRKQSQVLV